MLSHVPQPLGVAQLLSCTQQFMAGWRTYWEVCRSAPNLLASSSLHCPPPAGPPEKDGYVFCLLPN